MKIVYEFDLTPEDLERIRRIINIQLLPILVSVQEMQSTLTSMVKGVRKMTQQSVALQENLDELIASVAAEGNAVNAATAAIKGLTDQLALLAQELQDAIASADPVAIQAAADAIQVQNDLIVSQTAALAAAIPANTTPPVPGN